MTRVMTLSAFLTVACGSSPPPCQPAGPAGQPSAVQTERQVEVDECVARGGDDGGTFYRVMGEGHRRVAFQHEMVVGDCQGVPEATDPCERVNLDEFSLAVEEALSARLGQDALRGSGLGVCGEATDFIDDWNLSVSIGDYRQAEVAIDVVHEQMARYGIRAYGVSVRGTACSRAE